MRLSQGTHKTRQRERAAVGGRRGLTEVPQSRNRQKGGKEGFGRTAGGMYQQDSVGRAWRWNLGTEKCVMRPQASVRETQAAREDRRVAEHG